MRPLRFLFLVAGLLQPLLAAAVPFWGAKESRPADTTPEALKPGEWIWGGDNKKLGPMAVIVSLTEQLAYVYRNGLLIAVSTVSTGKPGHATPSGVFTVLQKDKDHHSSKYNDAPMPYAERLTWDGVALHAGGLPGFPESHGCVHLPTEFARLLFASSNLGMTVVISQQGSAPAALVHPGAASPINPSTGVESGATALSDGETFRWQPDNAPAGPISMVMSTADARLLVFRNGIEIGRSRIAFADPGPAQGTHAYIATAAEAPGTLPRWIRIGIPGHGEESGTPVTADDMKRVIVPAEFVALVLPLLEPGTVVLQTEQRVLPSTTGAKLQVMNSDPPVR
jgi:hypothetical protein